MFIWKQLAEGHGNMYVVTDIFMSNHLVQSHLVALFCYIYGYHTARKQYAETCNLKVLPARPDYLFH